MKPNTPHCRFALLRHAQTHWNAAKRIQGHRNSALTDFGRRQARRCAQKIRSFEFTAILASDLGRTLQTAAIINEYLNLPLAKDVRLREQDWGRWSGRTMASIQKKEGLLLAQQVAAGWDFRPPQGEDRRRVFERSRQALTAWAATSGQTTTLVVTHEGVVKCLLYGLSGRKFLPDEPPLIAANHLHWLTCRGGDLLIEQVNACDMNDGIAL